MPPRIDKSGDPNPGPPLRFLSPGRYPPCPPLISTAQFMNYYTEWITILLANPSEARAWHN